MTPRTLFRGALGLAVAGAALAVGYSLVDTDRAVAVAIPTLDDARPVGAADYTAYLAQLDDRIDGARERRDHAPDQWLRQSSFAAALARRASTAGSFADYVEADKVMEAALAVSPPGAGPMIEAAAHNLSLHRLDAAEAFLRRVDNFAVAPDRGDRAEMKAMRGDIAFYRGDYAEAATLYRAAEAIEPGAGVLVRMAEYVRSMGDLDRARDLVMLAGGTQVHPSRAFLARLHLQLANIEYGRGDWDRAYAHVQSATAIFPGYWLAEGYAAQLHALEGDIPAAIAAFEALVASWDHPEFKEILATLYREQGRDTEADRLVAQAATIWEQRLASLPAAYLGHAVEHHVKHGDHARALELAKRDHAARPYGGAAKMLAETYLLNDRPAAAEKLLRGMLESGWRSTETYLFLADSLEAQGKHEEAGNYRRRAVASDPRALDPAREYLWFGHS